MSPASRLARTAAAGRDDDALVARRRHLAAIGWLAGALLVGARLRDLIPLRRRARALAELLPPSADGRLRAALLLDAHDCASHVSMLDLFERPRVAAAVGARTVTVSGSASAAARAADALLTHGLDIPVFAWSRRDSPMLGGASDVPLLALLAPDGRLVLTARASTTSAATRALAAALEHLADHWVASELTPEKSR